MSYQNAAGLLPFCVHCACVSFGAREALNANAISSVSCVDPADFNTCVSKVDDAASTCENYANGDKLVLYGCGIAFYEGEINCYLASCWNKVRNASIALLTVSNSE